MHLFAGFSSQNLAQIFASGSQNLEKIPGIFLTLFKLLAHSHLPCLPVNPIPFRRHPSAGKVYAVNERGLPMVQENHRCVLLRGTFFQVAAQSAFLLASDQDFRIFDFAHSLSLLCNRRSTLEILPCFETLRILRIPFSSSTLSLYNIKTTGDKAALQKALPGCKIYT